MAFSRILRVAVQKNEHVALLEIVIKDLLRDILGTMHMEVLLYWWAQIMLCFQIRGSFT